MVKNLRRKLGYDAKIPSYILTEPRVGYRMAKAEEPAVPICIKGVSSYVWDLFHPERYTPSLSSHLS